MAERRPDHDEWNIHKDEIHKLYIEDDEKLSDVAVLMAQQHDFKRTTSQYERIVKKWGMKKYDTKEDWLFIARRVKHRKSQGRESEVKIRESLVPMPKVKRQISRYEYLLAPYRLPTSNRNTTPPHIHVYTPPRSPEPVPARLLASYYPDTVQEPCTSDMFITWANLTPWCQFMKFVRTPNPKNPVTMFLNQCPAGNQISKNNSGSAYSESTGLVIGHQLSKAQVWVDDISFSFWVELYPIPEVYSSLSSYLPPTPDRSVDINFEEMNDISRRSTQLECIKLAASLISNNHDTSRTAQVIVELAKNRSNLLTLKGLLNQKLLTVDAVAEKLLVPAVQYRNLPLLRTLVEHRVDVNGGLAYAIDNGDEETVTYLLDHGAETTISYDTWSSYKSMLDVAVARGNVNVIKDILTPRPNFRSGCPDITTNTLYIATLLGDISVMNFLVDRNPNLLDEIKSMPLLYEAAATHETVSTLTNIQNWGINVTATNSSGKGSALAAACYKANMPLIHRLLHLGADIDSVAEGISGYKKDDPFFGTRRHILSRMGGSTALYIAVEWEHEELVQFLLAKGANPNQCYERDYEFPAEDFRPTRKKSAIQLTLERGNESIFHILVKGGAEIPAGNLEAAMRDAIWNPLESAITGRNRNLVRYILESAGHNYWVTPQCLARCISEFGSDFTMTLFDHGTFAAKWIYDVNVLCSSVFCGDVDFVQSLILGTKSNLGELPPGYGAAGIALAVRFLEEPMIKLFLDAGVKPYELTDVEIEFREYIYLRKGTCALEEAFILTENGNDQLGQSRHLWSPKMLIDRCGAVLKDMKRISQNRGIVSAYGKAIARRRLDTVNIILETGLNIREIDESVGFGEPHEPRCSSLQVLLRPKDILAPESNDIHQIYEVAMALLKHGAISDCPAKGIYWQSTVGQQGIHTPLQYAAQLNATLLVKRLLDMGADVNAKPNPYKGATVLQFAAINGHFEILNILLEAGADINALPANCFGRSAIEGASEWGRLDMVVYLLEAGANVQGRENKNYRRSVYRAWENGHRCLARKIQDWKTDKFGANDCEDIHVIVESITDDELRFLDLDAKQKWEELCRGEDDLDF